MSTCDIFHVTEQNIQTLPFLPNYGRVWEQGKLASANVITAHQAR